MFKATIILMALLGGKEPEPVGLHTLDPVYETVEACQKEGRKFLDDNAVKIKIEADRHKIKVVDGFISCDPVEDRKI